ncbi:hypothetical protein [Sphingobium sp. CCH11-B1]|nr:hypothetical protein [Sphingobium sp. CCH11-B1]
MTFPQYLSMLAAHAPFWVGTYFACVFAIGAYYTGKTALKAPRP